MPIGCNDECTITNMRGLGACDFCLYKPDDMYWTCLLSGWETWWGGETCENHVCFRTRDKWSNHE